jgi:hypothetical protein
MTSLREELRDLKGIQRYFNVFTSDELSALLGTLLVDVHIENALAGVQDTMYPLVAPKVLSVVASKYVASAVFYTVGSLIEGSAGFAIHQTGV